MEAPEAYVGNTEYMHMWQLMPQPQGWRQQRGVHRQQPQGLGVETSERGAQAAATGMEAADEQQQQHRLMESRRSKHGVTVDITSLVLLRTRFFF